MDSSLRANEMASSLEEHEVQDSFLLHRASCSLLEDSWGSLQLPDSVDLTSIDSLQLLDSDLPNFNTSSLSASDLQIGDSEAWTLRSEIEDTIDNDGTCGLATPYLSLEVPDSSTHYDCEVVKQDRPILEEHKHLQGNPSQRSGFWQGRPNLEECRNLQGNPSQRFTLKQGRPISEECKNLQDNPSQIWALAQGWPILECKNLQGDPSQSCTLTQGQPISILEECKHLQSNPSQRCALMQMKDDKKLGSSNAKDTCFPAFCDSLNQTRSCIDEKENFLSTKEPIEIQHNSKHASELSFVTGKRRKTNWDSSETLDKQEQVLVEACIISAKNNNSPCDWRCPKEGKSKFKPKPRQQILDGWLFKQR